MYAARMTVSQENDKRREASREAFLAGVRSGGTVLSGCRAGEFSRTTYQRWVDPDHADHVEGFKEAFGVAMQDYRDSLVEEAGTRGRDGWREPVIHQGQMCWRLNPDGSLLLDDNFEPVPLTVLKKSDNMLIAQLKAHDPRYRDKAGLEISGVDGAPIKTSLTINFVDAVDGKPVADQEGGEPVDPLD